MTFAITASMPYPLPSEMTDQIIDHLHDDNTSLRACSLVCRTWVASAQYHIFYTVSLMDSISAESFAQLVEISPHIGQYVKVLNVEDGEPPYATSFVDETISRMAPRLMNVDTMWLCTINLGTADQVSTFANSFASIRTLSLDNIYFGTFQHFISLVTAYSCLEEFNLLDSSLSVEGDDEDETQYSDDAFAAPPTHLRRLSVIRCSHIHIIPWLISQSFISGIENLRIRELTRKNVPVISELLHSLGPSLEHLEIGLPTGTTEDNQGTLLSISQSTSMRVLHFADLMIYFEDREQTRAACEWVADTLSHVTSPHMEEIMFTVHYEATEELETLDLERIDAILQKSLFDRLQRVTFCMNGPLGQREKQELRRLMCGVDDRGLLQFQ